MAPTQSPRRHQLACAITHQLALRTERLTPLRSDIWHPAQVAKLLQDATRGDHEAASRRAQELRAQGMPLREIGIRLATEGFLTKVGRIWHPAQVHTLLASEKSAERASHCAGGITATMRRQQLRTLMNG